MLNNFSLYRFSIIILLVIFFPLFQNQWQNLHMFDESKFTFAKLLFYLSGIVFPFIVYYNSLNIFTFYKFDSDKYNKKFDINGKILLLFLILILVLFSKLIYNYFLINIDFLFQIFFKYNDKLTFELDIEIISIFIISILLIIKKTNILLKKFILANFLASSLFIWSLNINKTLTTSELLINKFFDFENLNLINIIFIVLLEIMFYFWTYISNKNNLSNWVVPCPNFNFLIPIYKIIIFYALILIYYLIIGSNYF